MTEIYLKKVEDALRSGGHLDVGLCQEFSTLQIREQIVFARAFSFIGCKPIDIPATTDNLVVPKPSRVKAARLMLLSLYMGTGEPRWSSSMIEQMWEAILLTPSGEFSDLYQALCELLYELNYDLTSTIATFIRSITHNGRLRFFRRYLSISTYSQEDYNWVKEKISKSLTKAQAYLFLYALPLHNLSPQISVDILISLLETQFGQEAIDWLYDSLASDGGKQLLVDWLNKNTTSPFKKNVENIIGSLRD